MPAGGEDGSLEAWYSARTRSDSQRAADLVRGECGGRAHDDAHRADPEPLAVLEDELDGCDLLLHIWLRLSAEEDVGAEVVDMRNDLRRVDFVRLDHQFSNVANAILGFDALVLQRRHTKVNRVVSIEDLPQIFNRYDTVHIIHVDLRSAG